MTDLDDATIDQLFAVLAKYTRIRERATQLTFRTADGAVESAAYRCLIQLAGSSMRSSRLAEVMVSDPSTVSRHVATLVDLGYVRREADPDDGRATLLVATEAGIARAEEIRAHRRARLQELLVGWSADDLHQLVSLLTRFVDAAEGLVTPPPCAATEPGAGPSKAIDKSKREVSHDK